jgi:two-component system sensor histidine kinase KdpD
MNKLLFKTPARGRQYVYSVSAIVLVSAFCFLLSEWLGYKVVAFILLFAVSLLAILFDILPVLLSAALSALIWNFFFIPPRFTIHVRSTEDVILFIMYFVIAMINGVLTYKIRQIEKSARIKEERANSVKLYNTILNSLSHELRTPIAAIIGATDNLQTNRELRKEDRDQLVAEISKASFRLNQQVENLLNISRLESGHIKPKNDWCDLPELVYDVVKRVEELNPGRKIHININQDFSLCKLDKGMLDQVIYNLLNNAAIHTHANSRIDIYARCHVDLLEIIIEDNGQGFKSIDANHAFDKFSRSGDSKGNGSGLGLSIVKGFTEALGGRVALEKSNSSGSRFVVSIPVKTSFIKVIEE